MSLYARTVAIRIVVVLISIGWLTLAMSLKEMTGKTDIILTAVMLCVWSAFLTWIIFVKIEQD